MKARSLVLLLFCFFSGSVYSQKRDIAKILASIASENSDTAKIRLYLLAATHYEKNVADSSIYFATKALELLKRSPNDKRTAEAYLLIANGHYYKESYDEAMNYGLKNIVIHERLKDSSGMAQGYIFLASLLFDVSSEKKSMSYYLKALEIAKIRRDTTTITNAYNDFAYIYNIKGKLDSALYYLLKVYEFDKARNCIDKEELLAGDENNIGSIYYNLKDFKRTEEYYMRSFERRKALGYKLPIMQSLNSIAALHFANKEYKKALPFLKESRNLAKELGSKNGLISVYSIYNHLYYETDDFFKAALYADSLLIVKQELFDEEKAKISDESEAKYQNEKKQLENAKLQIRNELSEKVIKQQRQTFYIISIALIVTLFLAYTAYRSFRKQRSANVIIEQQKKLVDEKQKEILDSIQYAKRIQSTMLAPIDFLNEHLPSSFTLFKPKDIVSGDFYWATEYNKKFFLAVCDSTGHGVPGAFMSLMNMGFLSEAINEKGIEEPHKIFNYVRDRLIAGLSKEGQKDGFDGILVCFDKTTNKISYAAAHNAPIIIRKGEILELEKDKMPVGKGERTESFKTFELTLEAKDTLYLYTDGYADQFGGPKGKKFLYKKLNQLIADHVHLPLKEQKEKLENEFERWKGDLEQVDDVLIIGIKI